MRSGDMGGQYCRLQCLATDQRRFVGLTFSQTERYVCWGWGWWIWDFFFCKFSYRNFVQGMVLS